MCGAAGRDGGVDEALLDEFALGLLEWIEEAQPENLEEAHAYLEEALEGCGLPERERDALLAALLEIAAHELGEAATEEQDEE
jgi:hypothetical protein